MIVSSLIGAAALFIKFAPYIVGIKLCTSSIDVAATYIKHQITRGDISGIDQTK
jgi:hypothetical protein